MTQSLGNYLKSSWKYILENLSTLDYLHSLANGKSADFELYEKEKEQCLKNELKNIEIKDPQNLLVSIDSSSIDRIFASSPLLTGDALKDLIKNLCIISK